jgi:hypothetical protein
MLFKYKTPFIPKVKLDSQHNTLCVQLVNSATINCIWVCRTLHNCVTIHFQVKPGYMTEVRYPAKGLQAVGGSETTTKREDNLTE